MTNSKVEQHKVRGRNTFDIINQIVEKYNSSNGWALKRVNPSLMSIEVILERSVQEKVEDGKSSKKEGDSKAEKDKGVKDEQGKESDEAEKSTNKPESKRTTTRSKQTASKAKESDE